MADLIADDRESADVLVVGGGVIGCAIARCIAKDGGMVTVFERSEPGAEASWAAAGMLGPQAEADEAGPFLDLLRAGRQLFPALAEALRAETGIDIGYRSDGTLLLALTDEDEATLETRYGWQSAAGLPVERLDARAVRAAEPAVTPQVRWALRFPEDHQVENRSLSRALWSAAVQAGARVRTGETVTRVLHREGRATGLELAGGRRVAAGSVVIAGGSWAGVIGGLPRPLPVVPVHGQLLALETLPPLLTHVVDSPRVYLVPRADGRLIVGATVEEWGFRKAVTPEGLMHLLSGALEISPALRRAAVVEHWSGLRPGTPDQLPILGPDPDIAGLFYAAGHYRNGILLAPLTGEIIRDLLTYGRASHDLTAFRPDRF